MEQYAHAGTITLPEATYANTEVTGTMFEHTEMTGSGYLPREFSCAPIQEIIDSASAEGKVEVKKHVEVYSLTYQNERNGPIVAIETREKVRLTFANGIYITSSKSIREKQ